MIVILFPFSVDKSVSHRPDYSPLHKKVFYFTLNFYFLHSPGKNESLMLGKTKTEKEGERARDVKIRYPIFWSVRWRSACVSLELEI